MKRVLKKSFVWFNGRIVPESEARIPVFDSAYLYGLGVFETMKAERGRILFFPDHFSRMAGNARRIGLKLPLSALWTKREILRTLSKNRLKEAYVRMILSRNQFGSPHFVVIARPFVPYPKRCYRQGARLVIAKTVQADTKTMASIKTTSYLTKMLAREEAEKRGADEGVLLNDRGHVTEGASSNIFLVKNGRILTPPLPEGLLPGTRRKLILRLAKKLKIPLREKPLFPKDLRVANEAFITSAVKDVMPVGYFEGKKIGKKAPGPITMRLIASYQRLLRM